MPMHRLIERPVNARRRHLVSRAALILILAGLVTTFFALGLQHGLSLAALQANRQQLQTEAASHPLLAPLAFGSLYVALAAVSLPVNIPLALAAGAVFGLAEGAALVSFASAMGATLAMLSGRFLFCAAVHAQFGHRLVAFESGIARDGLFYLLSLRLIPAIPYTVVNLLFGLTELSAWRFYWVSQLGMLPATLVYVNAGTHLQEMRVLSDILTPSLLLSLLMLAVVPLLARLALGRLRQRAR